MKYKINLLPQPSINLVDRAFYFVLNYLRYILVITQLCVIAVFFYRFQVDQDITDTAEAVTQKQEILMISKPLIDETKKINFKTSEIQKSFDKQEDFLQMVNYLLSVFPQGLTLSSLSVNSNNISFRGRTGEISILQLFYQRLRQEGRFGSARLVNIEKKSGIANFSFELANFIPKK